MNIGKIKLDFLHFCILMIGVGVVLLVKQCNSVPPRNAFAEKMMKEKTADSIKRVEERKVFQDSLREINGREQLHEIIINEQAKNLKILDNRIDKFLATSENLPAPIPFDSTSSIVSNEQIRQCIECKVLLKDGRDSVKQYVHERDELDNLYKRDTKLLGEHISRLDKMLDQSENAVTKWTDKYKKDTQPKYHLYAGSKISGNLITPFNQVGGMLNFLDKKGRMFTVGGGLQTQASWYGELGISIRIF